MQILKEKVLGIKGNIAILARFVTFNTPDTGRVQRVELCFKQQGPEPQFGVGFTLGEMRQFHDALATFAQENNL